MNEPLQASVPHSTTPLGLRLPSDLRAHLKAQAEANRRSLNSELVFRLEQTRRVDVRQAKSKASV